MGWGYIADGSGTVVMTGNKRIYGISASSEAGGTVTINGGDVIIVPAMGSFQFEPQGLLVDPTIVFTGTDTYLIEYAD